VEQREVIIIGAGLAGLTAATELARGGRDVLVFEKHHLPRHKVCGEYLSLEVVPHLSALGIPLADAPRIEKFLLCSSMNSQVRSRLDPGGVGISRHALDYRVYQAALKAGVTFRWDPVEKVRFEQGRFLVFSRDQTFKANQVLGAWGKRSSLDRALERPFFKASGPWLGIKMHYRASYPSDQVGLYAFKGGYGGLSVTETGAVNFCYLIHRDRFRDTPSLETCTTKLLEEHPSLQEVLDGAEPLFGQALSISNVYFGKKELCRDHVLMSGDAARLIHPLSGNGMAMAIRTGSLQAGLVEQFLSGALSDRKALETAYRHLWKKEFGPRLRVSAWLQGLLTNPKRMELGIQLATRSPFLLRKLIRKTHGRL
jgi:flavin-dependent dehydrogenase